MKDLIFVTCLYFQILLVQCDIFVNNLNGSDAKIKMCIQKTINHLFSENDTLSVILNNNNLCEDGIFEMITKRPYMVLNMDVINDVNKLQYDGQFIICPKDIHSLNRAMHRTFGIADRNNRSMGSSKILVITNATDTSWMFEMFWHYGINNVIILVYGRRTSKLFTCNRFAPENASAKTAELMISQDCEEQLSLSFTNVVRQMNKCPVIFWFQFSKESVYRNESFPITRTVQYVIKELSHRLNATFQRTAINNLQQYDYLSENKGLILIGKGADKILGEVDLTKPLIRGEILWFVPKAKQTSNMNVCLKVFNYDVWTVTSVIFICVCLLWFLIISRNEGFTFNKLCLSFLNVWSLTIFGNVVSPLSRSLALHILLFFYLIYAINLQFAFTSDMSTVLTAPRYEFQIRNLEELADSHLPIYSTSEVIEFCFKKNYTDRKLYTKLQNLMHAVSTGQYFAHLRDLHLRGNYAVISKSDDIRHFEIAFNRRIEAYKITDDSIAPVYKVHLSLPTDHYFSTTLKTFVSKMIENGVHEKRKNDFYHEFDVEKVDTTPQDDLLTLKHLTFIFVFFGIGLCTACVVFCFELVLHKFICKLFYTSCT